MLAKINSLRVALFLAALVLVAGGCTPAGPRALLAGKKYLDASDDAAAAAQFQIATTLLVTNAGAWNYYGVALQRTGQPADAAHAYQMALKYDRDLVEAHFNLGSLWLEQGKADGAAAEFTAYTLHRPNDVEGWRKLGAAQLKLGQTIPAERSFSSVLTLKKEDAEAYHGLGLARVQRGKYHDAALFFAAAVKQQPDFAPALLDLAIVTQQYLRDPKTALVHYRAWLALTPRAANWDEVNTLANGLEQSLAAVLAPVVVSPPPPKNVVVATAAPPVLARVSVPVPNPVVPKTSPPPAHPVVATNSLPMQVVTVPPAPQIVAVAPPKVMAAAAPEEIPLPEPEPKKSGFWHKLFSPEKSATAPRPEFLEKGLTPLPSPEETAARARRAAEPPAPASFARYQYLSPRPAAAGNHAAAAGAFTKAQLAEQAEKWLDAEQWYQQAAEFDPAWFEAQFNSAAIAHRLRNYSLALMRYEQALALRPGSVDARYNFALALAAAGHVPDAVTEFKKILAAEPNEIRAHLALANLYAQTLKEPAAARPHYQQVLALDPQHPAAADIRFWLGANPE